MNRPIKYRQFYKGTFYYWGYIDGNFIYPITNSNGVKVESDEFTGLLDKDGKEIYEDDVVEYPINENVHKGIVKYLAPKFFVMDGDKSGLILTDKYVVIGNLYENPDLLK